MSSLTFETLTEKDLPQVLKWRSSDRINAVSLSKTTPCLDRQTAWFHTMSQDSKQHYWTINLMSKPIGIINVMEFDKASKSTKWGYYIGDKNHLGLGAFVPPYLYNWLFFELNFNEVQFDILSDNKTAIKLCKIHGAHKNSEQTIDSKTIYKMMLSANDWQKMSSWHNYKSHFSLEKS